MKYICGSDTHNCGITTEKKADYKVINTDIIEEDQGSSFLSYTSQFSLVILQFLQHLSSVQHHLP